MLAKVLNWSCHWPQTFSDFFNQFIWNWHNPMFRGPFCAALHTSINIQLRSRGVGPLQFAPLWRLHYSNLVFWGPFAAQLLGIQLGCGDVGLRGEELDYCCYFHSHDPISTYNVLLVKMVYNTTVLLLSFERHDLIAMPGSVFFFFQVGWGDKWVRSEFFFTPPPICS